MLRPQITRRNFMQSTGAATGTLWTIGATAARKSHHPRRGQDP